MFKVLNIPTQCRIIERLYILKELSLKFKYLIIVVGIFLAIFSFQYFNEDLTDFDLVKKSSSGQYLESDIGSTRYQIFGESNSEVIIFVNASNGYLEQWNPNIKPLVNAGYKVVVYDLFGHGLSDRPRINLDLTVFRNQLGTIIDEVAVDKVNLIGSSFGSIIASDYALNNQERVQKIILVGPAGWPSDLNKSSLLLDVPVVGEFIFHYFGQKILKPRVEGYFYNKEKYLWAIEEWQTFSSYPGFTRSYLSILRYSPVLDYTDGWKKLGLLNKPTLFIWGKDDISFPFSNSEKATKFIPYAEIVGIEKAAHWVNIEQPLQVNEAIVSFLTK